MMYDERQDERTNCTFSLPCRPDYTISKKEVRTESDSVALDLQNDYIIDSFGYYRDINFVQEGFELEVIYKGRVIVLIVVVSQEVG